MCHAYALSARGAAKLARSGFREAVFPVDDFLPALHAGHPRPDLMSLRCVRAARGEGADAFVALTFVDDAGLVCPPERAAGAALDSDSKAGSGSSVLLGDTGVQTDAGGEVVGRGVAPAEAEGAGASAASAPFELPPPISLAELLGGADAGGEGTLARARGRLVHELRLRGFGRLRLAPDALATLLAAESAALAFFGSDDEHKLRCVGRGGRSGQLMLWSCGYTAWPHRQHWHLVLGAPDAQPWPEQRGDEPPMRDALLQAAGLLREAGMACVDALAESGEGGEGGEGGEEGEGGGGAVRALRDACQHVPPTSDPSVLDAFLYAAARRGAPDAAAGGAAQAREVHMAAHTDPGVLTLTRRSAIAGLEVWDPPSASWAAVEQLAEDDDVIVLTCEALEQAAAGRVRAAQHRVMAPIEPRGERCSVVYELRAPEVPLPAPAS